MHGQTNIKFIKQKFNKPCETMWKERQPTTYSSKLYFTLMDK